MEKIFIHRRKGLLKKLHIAFVSAAAVMILGLGVTAGAETGAFIVTGGVEGADYEYAANVLTVKTAKPLAISTSGSTADSIQIASAEGANITLEGVDIESASSPFHIMGSAGAVTLTLADDSVNTLVCTKGYAGLQKDNGAELIICGGDYGTGSLIAEGAEASAGIGGGDSDVGAQVDADNITITGGIISATGGWGAAGIGGGWKGDGKNITITGGAVTASGGDTAASIGGGYDGIASDVVITGGSVLAYANVTATNDHTYTCNAIGGGLIDHPTNSNLYQETDPVTPTDGEGNNVYLLVIPNPTNGEVLLDGVAFTPTQHPGTTELYFYLTAEEHNITVDGVETGYFFNPDTETWTQPGTELIITGTGLKHGTDFIYPADTGILTILTDKAMTIANADKTVATDNIIVVADGVAANITLNGVNISSDSAAALEIIENTAHGDVTITLADGTTNSLVSTGAFAGLQKEGENGALLISGSGSLTVNGGTAGIGGAGAHNITISGTTVTATGGNGAGIGGSDSAVSDIVIEDSIVIAEGGSAAGIGSADGAVTNITIIDSIVTAAGSGAAGIGGTASANVSGIVKDGGSVKAEGGNGSPAIGGNEAEKPANKQDQFVYLLTIENPNGDSIYIKSSDEVNSSAEEYIPSQHSADDTNVYVYLPPANYVITVGDTDTPYYFDSTSETFKSPQLKVIGGRLGEDYSFDAGVVTILSDKALTIENYDKTTSATDTIVIKDGISADITLNGVDIDGAGSALTVGNGSSVRLTLADGTDNVLKSSSDVISIGEGADVTVDGTGWLTIAGDAVGTTDSSFEIMSGSVTVNSISAEKVVIDGGSVKASAISPAPVNADGENVYLLKITDSVATLEIDGAAYVPTQHGIDNDKNVYAYLTGEVHTVKLDKPYTYHFNGTGFYLPDLNVYGNGVDLVIGSDYNYSNGVVTINTTKPVIIENIDPDNATADTIIIAGGVNADVTLNGVNIGSSSTAAVLIEESTANVVIRLAESSENHLTSAASFAGIQKNGTSGSLEITGSGSLNTRGGWRGAGIGGGESSSTGNIIISGGVINASTHDLAAGIGGGYCGSASDITIKNATVTATGGDRGAGIGGGGKDNGSGSADAIRITITDAQVTATGGKQGAGIGSGCSGYASQITINSGTVQAKGGSDSAGIGGGYYGDCYNVVINGGTVVATGDKGGAGIGGGYGSSGYNITINGGSVTADSGNQGACIGGGNNAYGGTIVINGGSVKTIPGANEFGGGANRPAVAPVNSDNVTVYLLTLENPNNDTITIDGEEFLPKQHSVDDTNVYVYLTPEAHTVQIGNGDVLTYIYDQYADNGAKFIVIGGDLAVTGGTYGLDYKYPVNGPLTILTDTAMTITNTVATTDDVIVIDTGIDADITLDGVNIVSGAAALTADGGNITITLEADNVLKSTGGNGIDISGTGSLTVTGTGTLLAGGTVGINAVQATVELDNCIVTADGGIKAAKTVIKSGSVKADSVDAAPVNAATDGEALYLLKIEANGKTVSVDGTEYPVQSHGIGGDTNVYAYLTGKTHVVELDDEEIVYVFDGTKFKLPDLVVSGSGVAFGRDYDYENGILTIKTNKAMTIANNPDVDVTSDRIVTQSGITANITLNGVNIETTTGSSVEINGNANITMEEGAANVLTTGMLVNGNGTLKLDGSGELSADISAASASVTIENVMLSASAVEAAELLMNGGAVTADSVAADTFEISGSVVTVNSIEVGTLITSGDEVTADTIKADTLKISGGSVTANTVDSDAPVVTGGSVKATLTSPTDGTNAVHPLTIPTGGNTVTINDGDYPVPEKHSDSDNNIYAYLPDTGDHTVTVGEDETIYRYSSEKAKFLIVPTADMFDVALPDAPVYNGAPITAQAIPVDATMAYTVTYYNEDGTEAAETASAGTYTFKISVSGDDNYAAEELTDNSWTFTVEGARLDAPASLIYNVGYGYKVGDAVRDTSTGAMAAGAYIVDGEWELQYDGYFTESGNDYTAVFTPNDTNYHSFTFTSVQVVVNAVDPVVTADPINPRVIPGKSQTFTFKAEHPKYPEFTDGLPEQITSISDGVNVSDVPVYTVDKNVAIGSTINITVNIAGVDGKYNASSAVAVITAAPKLNVDSSISVNTEKAVYGSVPIPQGIFSGTADGEAEWSYSFASGDTGADGNFGTLEELYNEFGALDVGIYTVKAHYEDAAHVGVGYGTFEVEPKALGVEFNGGVSKVYDGTTAVIGYEMNADDFELTGLVGSVQRVIETAYITMEYTDVNAGTGITLDISIGDGTRVLTSDGTVDNNYTVVSEAEADVAVITRRPVTVIPEEASKVYGQDDPAFSFTVEDIITGDTLNGELSRDTGENAGTYAINLGTVTNENNANYDISMQPAALVIEKAAAPVVAAVSAKHSWGASGEKNVAVVGMPDDMGEIISVDRTVTDENDIISETVSYMDGLVTYSLNTNTIEKVGSNAVIVITVASQNYEDISFEVTVTVTAKEDQASPTLTLRYEEMADGALIVIITPVDGAEYKFAEGEWSDVNSIENVLPNTYVTAYIRMAETETHNASEAVMITELTPKTVVKTPVFSKPTGTSGIFDVEITCSTVGATILYTTNGLDPLVYGEIYSAPIAVNSRMTLKAAAIKDGMTNSEIAVAEYNQPTSSGGSTGGSVSGGGSGSGGSSAPLDEDAMHNGSAGSGMPSIDGKINTWYTVAQIISELPVGGTLEVQLNNSNVVPDFVIDAIAERDAKLIFEYNSLNHWFVDGADIADDEEHKAANLNVTYPVRIPSYDLRGKAKWKFRIGNTNLSTTLTMDVDIRNAGNFANLYKYVDEELIFVDCVRIDKDGLAEFFLTEKGDYVVMASMYSDIMGDTNNDGRINSLDAVAILRDIVGLQNMPDAVVADCNSDGIINVLDASAILKWIVGKTA